MEVRVLPVGDARESAFLRQGTRGTLLPWTVGKTVTFHLRNYLVRWEAWGGEGGVCLWKGNPQDQERARDGASERTCGKWGDLIQIQPPVKEGKDRENSFICSFIHSFI